MRAYADSSFLLRLVCAEPGTEAAISEYRRLNRPGVFYLTLHALEVENAIRQRAFHERRVRPSNERARIKRERDSAFSRLGQLQRRRALIEVSVDVDRAMDRARELSRSHGESLGVRAIDLLHVACALTLHSEVFLSFDSRQLQLAKAQGLDAPSLASPE